MKKTLHLHNEKRWWWKNEIRPSPEECFLRMKTCQGVLRGLLTYSITKWNWKKEKCVWCGIGQRRSSLFKWRIGPTYLTCVLNQEHEQYYYIAGRTLLYVQIPFSLSLAPWKVLWLWIDPELQKVLDLHSLLSTMH